MSVKMQQKRQVDIILLGFALSATVLLDRLAPLASTGIVAAQVQHTPHWHEEALFAKGRKISLQNVSVSGLQLIEGVGDTLAEAIVSNRSKLLSWCDSSTKTYNENRQSERKRNKGAPALDVQALDSVPGIGVVRSEIILKYLTLCEPGLHDKRLNVH